MIRTTTRALGLVFWLIAPYASAQPGESCWKGALEVLTRSFPASDGEVFSVRLVYDIYQNRAGVVRRELKHSEPPLSGVVGIGRDVHIIDYQNGSLLAFDKNTPKAIRVKRLEGREQDPLKADVAPGGDATRKLAHERHAPMKVLGYECERVTNRMTFPDRGVAEDRESWVAASVGFRHPIVDIVISFVPPGGALRAGGSERLRAVTISTITRLERIAELDASLFQLPPGYEVIDMPSPKPH